MHACLADRSIDGRSLCLLARREATKSATAKHRCAKGDLLILNRSIPFTTFYRFLHAYQVSLANGGLDEAGGLVRRCQVYQNERRFSAHPLHETFNKVQQIYIYKK